MLDLHRPAADARPMARRLSVRPAVWVRRAGIVVGVSLLAIVTFIGAAHPLAAAGGTQPTAVASGVSTTAVSVGSAWDSSPIGGVDPLDLIAKGAVVLLLLFITLRVLGRMQSGGPKREGRLVVLESRPLAPKASLHLVAVGGRRLVVGLTPSGMVSLAELDASEFKEEETETALADSGSLSTASAFGATASIGAAPTTARSFATAATAAFLAPIDAVAGRLAAFFSGGRVR